MRKTILSARCLNPARYRHEGVDPAEILVREYFNVNAVERMMQRVSCQFDLCLTWQCAIDAHDLHLSINIPKTQPGLKRTNCAGTNRGYLYT